VLYGDSAPHGKGHNSPHLFSPFALALSAISTTAELLLMIWTVFMQSTCFVVQTFNKNTVTIVNHNFFPAVDMVLCCDVEQSA